MEKKTSEKVPFLEYRELLVTGGSGFIGTRVCRALIARGWMPRLLVREGSEGKIPLDVRRRCRITVGDVTDSESVINAAQSTDAIVHLVGIIKEEPERGITFDRLHVEATHNVLVAAEHWRIPRIVHMSALGASSDSSVDYFRTKGKAEEMVRASGFDWTVIRPSIVYGDGDHFLSLLKEAVAKSPILPVPGDGRFEMQPIWVGDVARGFAEALSRPETVGRCFDAGGMERFRYDELLDLVGESVGRGPVRKVHVPMPLSRAGVRMLSRFEAFPMTPTMLDMLALGSICDPMPYFQAFEGMPVSLREYLGCSSGSKGAVGIRKAA